MSISKSQAAALAEGFLDHLGTDDKSELIPRELLTEVFLIAGELVEETQVNLNQGQHNASGSLSKSIKLATPKESGTIVSVDMMMLLYGLFLNDGVKGTKSGSGKYRFKTDMPSRKMVESLRKGISRARNKITNTSRRTTSSNERKNIKLSDIDKAWGAARNIKMYGIKPTGFLNKAVISATHKMQDRLGSALKIDIINSL